MNLSLAPRPESYETRIARHDLECGHRQNAAIGSAKAEGRVMLTGEQDGKIEFIERDSNVCMFLHRRSLVLRGVQHNSLF